MTEKVKGNGELAGDEAKAIAFRLIRQGRITFLLDSLDQADRPKAIKAIRALHNNAAKCRIWISGRPYAFRETSTELREMCRWQFLRILPQDEPECRQLLEYHRENRTGSV